MRKRFPLIIDVDTGIDDAVALVFAGYNKKIDLKLVSTVFGNVELKKVIKNTFVILEDMNRTDVKVVKGESVPLKIDEFNVSAHGKNGLGGYTHPTKMKISKENYIDSYHNIISSNEMTYIVSCAPLTNLAKFIEAHPEDNNKIQLILVTGLLDIDKEHPYLNFNIGKDKSACEIVLKSYKNITIIPSDMGHLSYIPSDDFIKTEKCGRLGKILASIYPYHLDRTVKNGAAMHDLAGVLWLSNPELFTTTVCKCSFKSNKKGTYLDFDFDSKEPNVKIATNVKVKKLHKLYYKTLKGIK